MADDPPAPEPSPSSSPAVAEPLICSAKGCANPATTELGWNNPKVHTPDRRKVWLACDDHRQSLADFLSARSFLRDTTPLGGQR